MAIPYVYVDVFYEDDKQPEYRGICVKFDNRLIKRELSEAIKIDAAKVGEFLAHKKYSEWLYASSIDNYPDEIAEYQGLDFDEYPDYDLRQIIQEAYLNA
jgi:hypothetical protein